jgi:transposase-like protein
MSQSTTIHVVARIVAKPEAVTQLQAVLAALLEQEREVLCGPRYRHLAGRTASRNGYAPGELVLGGRRVSVKRPRARAVGSGEEVALPSWEHLAKEDPLTARAVEQMLVGVSTRKYKRSLEAMPAGVEERGTSRSAVSRRFVAATEEELTKHWNSSLMNLPLAALMVDGIVCGEHTILAAIGIDEKGNKHALGLVEGATESASACTIVDSRTILRIMKGEQPCLQPETTNH